MQPTRSTSLVPLLLLVVVALIVYGSLYPFNFKPDAIEGGLLQALNQLSWARAGRGDRIANVLLYLPLGFCLFLWLNTRFGRRVAVCIAVLLGSALSLLLEVAQVYVSVRVPSLTDWTLNALGTSLGALGGLVWRALGALMYLPNRPEKTTRDPGAAFLILLWLAWRTAPFMPMLDLGKLKAALRPLFTPHFEASAVFVWLTYWLVISQAIAALVSRQRSLEALLIVIATVLVGRLIVANQAFVPSELLALIALLPLVVLMHRLTFGPRRAILVITVAAVTFIQLLAPFNFADHATRFELWPFMSWFDHGVIAALESFGWTDFFGKLFLFGALIWVIRHSGTPINFAVAAVTVLVLVIEILQLWLPPHTGAIGDPLLALMVGLVFRFLYLQARRDLFSRRATARHARNL